MGDVIIDGNTGANRLVILDANGKIPAVDGSNVTLLVGANFSTGTIPVARIDTGTAAGKVVKLDGNAKLPAVSGAALTGVVGATKNASNPVLATNPSGGVGTEWQNTTTGEIFICTDATAGANVWMSTGGRSGNIIPTFYSGENYGYCVGGRNQGAGNTIPWAQAGHSTIQKFSLTSDGNSVDTNGDLTSSHDTNPAGFFSSTHGYSAGGYAYGTHTGTNIIDKFSFSAGGNAVDVGDMLLSLSDRGGVTDFRNNYGFMCGGSGSSNSIEKRNLSNDTASSTDHGDLTAGQNYVMCVSSTTHGFAAGMPTAGIGFERFAYASNTTATDWADLAYSTTGTTASDVANGYICSANGNTPFNAIQKFPYASQTNATDVGDMSVSRWYGGCGVTSTTHGYSAGGQTNAPSHVHYDVIDKWSFAAGGTATDVGNLVSVNWHAASPGVQY